MANQWLRLWHDMPTDPKWRFIAKVSGRPLSEVQAVFLHLLVRASEHNERGHVPGLTCNDCHECHAPSRDSVTCHDRSLIEALSTAVDTEIDHVRAIINAMQGRVMDGDWITGWDKRQPKKEDVGNPETGAKSAAERQRESRNRRKSSKNNNDESQSVTTSHGASREVTLDKDKEEDKENLSTSGKPSTAAAVKEVFDYWKATLNHPKAFFDEKRKRLIENRLKQFSVDDLKAAIRGCSISPHHMGLNSTGTKYDSIELILRDAGKVEFFMAIKPTGHPVTSALPLDAPPANWWETNSGIEAMARELGIEQGPDQWHVFKRKVIEAAKARENSH